MPAKIDRRNFIQGVMASTGAWAGLSALGGNCAAAPEQLTAGQSSKFAREALETDVLVVGAGPSGVPATIAAARAGARVILFEEDMMPGGAPVDMYVSMLCGGPRLGIFREMTELLNARHDLSGKPVQEFAAGTKNGNNYMYLPSSFIQAIMTLLGREKNIKLVCGARAIGALVEEASPRNRVKGVLIERLGGERQAVKAAVTIDATGTGLVAHLAGCQTMYGRNARGEFGEPFGPEVADNKVMPCTWMFFSQRFLPGAAMPVEKLKCRGLVENGVNHWVGGKGLEAELRQRNAGIYLHWGATVLCEDTRDPVYLAQAQQAAYEKLEPDLLTLMENGFGVHLAPKLGVRECRRVIGEHVITVHELKSGKLPDDVVALSNYGLDLWGEKVPKALAALPPSGIPYRALIPKEAEGLLVAGKAISGTHTAASSYRVQPIVASIGQAAGTAAALAVQKKTSLRSLPLAELQQQLKTAGLLPA